MLVLNSYFKEMLRLLVILSLSLLLVHGSKNVSLTDITDNSAANTYDFDDDALLKLKQQIELLNTSNEILRMRFEVMTTRMDQQLEILNELSSRSNEKAQNHEPLIDIRAGVLKESDYDQTTCKKSRYPRSCSDIATLRRKSGIYTIQLDTFITHPFLVYCDEDTKDGSWTVIQRRVDDTIDFYRDWDSYKIGFGNLLSNFFIGLDQLHALTTEEPQELLVVLTDFDNVTKYAKYDSFAIGNESEMYALKVLGKYSGDAGDSLTYHVGQKFTTKDKKNDIHTTNCAVQFKGAWWYKNCLESNLNGLYLKGAYKKDKFAQGIDWNVWRGHYYSLQAVSMLIRPKRA